MEFKFIIQCSEIYTEAGFKSKVQRRLQDIITSLNTTKWIGICDDDSCSNIVLNVNCIDKSTVALVTMAARFSR